MKKQIKYIGLILLILFVDFTEFYVHPFPYTFFDLTWLNNPGAIIPDIIAALLYFTVNVFVCVYSLTAVNTKSNGFALSIETFKKCFLILLAIKLGIDFAAMLLCALLYACGLTDDIAGYVQFAGQAAFLFVSFDFCNKRINTKQRKRHKFGKIQVITAIIIIVSAIAAYYALAVNNTIILNHQIEKYSDINYAKTLGQYRNYTLQICNMFVNFALWISLMHIYGISYGFEYDDSSSELRYMNLRAVFISLIKGVSAVIITLIFLALKTFILPHGMISEIGDSSFKTVHYSGEKDFNALESTKTVTRSVDYNNKVKVYEETKVTVVYGNDSVINFRTLSDDGMAHIDVPFTAARYGTDAVAWVEGDTPKAVLTKNISHCKENKYLTQALEYLVKEGDFEYFEYGCDYLLRHDRDFILPYIKRYANDNFNDKELKNSAHIKRSYMKAFSEKIKSDLK